MEIKKCTKCRVMKSIGLFSWKNKAKEIKHPNCKVCVKKTWDKHYAEHKEDYKRRAAVNSTKQRKRHGEKVAEYLRNNPCVDCGEDDLVVLQFDHIIGEKRNNISALVSGSYSWKTIEVEIAKCEVRCANCHTRKTAKQFGWKYKTGSVA